MSFVVENSSGPEIILGTVQLGLPYGVNNFCGQPTQEDALTILQTAYDLGLRSLDTAQAYGSSLEVVKHALRRGLKFKIFTKIKPDESNTRTYIEDLCDSLGVKELDGVSLHADLSHFSHESIDALKALRSDGVIKKLGVSVYDHRDCVEASKLDFIDLVQLPFNLLDGWKQRGASLRLLKAEGKTVHVRSVFLQGMFFSKKPHAQLAVSVQALQVSARAWPGGITQMAIDYVRGNPFVDGMLFGAETVEQVKQNYKMCSGPLNAMPLCPISLSTNEMRYLDPRTWI